MVYIYKWYVYVCITQEDKCHFIVKDVVWITIY